MIKAFDDAVDNAFVPLRKNLIANRVFYAASEAANHSLLWHSITWAQVLLKQRTVREALKISVALGIESALINGPVKMLFRRERPTLAEERPHNLRTPKTSSFPSGHATSGFCAAMLLTGQRKRPIYFLLGAIVASSRVHVRIHHASDVVAGAAIGAGVGFGLRKTLLGHK